jgi:cobalt/nickel transport system permease protein
VAFVCALEITLSGTSPPVLIAVMVPTHALIGIGEALITATIFQVVLKVRPDSIWALKK